MVEIIRPNLFPECKNCPVAGSQIIRLNNAEKFDKIWVDCQVSEGFFSKSVLMRSGGSGSDSQRLAKFDIVFKVDVEENVTRKCPGIKKRR